MNRPTYLSPKLTALATAVILAVAAVSTVVAADPADLPVPSDAGIHCASQLAPLQAGEDTSKILASGCFDSLADSIAWATDGDVRLPADIGAATVTDEMVGPASHTAVISIDYEDPKWDANAFGPTYTWTGGQNGCNDGSTYAVSSMPSGWDNQVSSARSYTGCAQNRHYENTSYGGASQNCSCYTMDAMNDKTSSEKWSR